MTDGLVIKQEANFYSVATSDQLFLCTMRANLRKGGEQIKVGDRVRLEYAEDERPVVAEVYPRTSELDKPTVANVDQAIIVMSCLQPDFNPMLVDRLLLAIAWRRLQAVICISKADLMDEELEEWLREEYAGFPIYTVSSETGLGIADFRQSLMGHVSVLAGASGTGKSSLVNVLDPAIELVTGEVNQKLGTGKHTTRHVSLHRIGRGENSGWLADTPGFSALQLPPIEPADLGSYYPEFLPFLGQCEFANCLHHHETDCAVQAGIDTDSERYYNYLRLLDELQELRQQRKHSSAKEEGLTKVAIGKNQRDQVLKLGTLGRVRSRRTQRQIIEQVGNWSELDDESLEDLQPDEWRI
ncbi:MAG: ribosome small subunit-dependent GTPase A [Candidatus Sericytochromatia bacterium]